MYLMYLKLDSAQIHGERHFYIHNRAVLPTQGMHVTKKEPQGGKAQPSKVRWLRKSAKALALQLQRIFVQSHCASSRISKSRLLSLNTTTHHTTMNCTRCLRTAIQRPLALPFRRNITTTRPLSATAAPRQGNPSTSAHTPSAATSTGAAQPFSTPLSSSPSAAELQAPSNAEKAAPTVKSSVAAGTPLKGLNFVKGKNDPVALEDGEYPAWLWGILKKKGGAESEGGAASVEGDLFCMCFFLCLSIFPSPTLFSFLFAFKEHLLTFLQPSPKSNAV